MNIDKFKIAYKKWFNNLDESPPTDTWEGIEDQLDLDDVWGRLEEDLDASPTLSPAPTPNFWKPVLVAGILFILTIPTDTQDHFQPFEDYVPRGTPELPLADAPSDNTSAPSLVKPGVINDQEVLSSSAPTLSNDISTIERSETPAVRSSSTEAAIADGASHRSSSNRVAGVVGASDPASVSSTHVGESADGSISTQTPDQLASNEGIGTETQTPQQNVDPDPLPYSGGLSLTGSGPSMGALSVNPKPLPGLLDYGTPDLVPNTYHDGYVVTGEPGKRGLHLTGIGIVGGFKNTWLLNPETYTGWRSESLMETMTSFGWDIGATSRWAWGSQQFGFDFYGLSTVGQSYKKYVNARYAKESIELRYIRSQFTYRIPILSLEQDILVGVYGGLLMEAHRDVLDLTTDITSHYKTFDYGVVVGYQRNIPISERIQIHPGIMFQYGLTNIFKGTDHMPANFRRTYPAAISFNIGASYRF